MKPAVVVLLALCVGCGSESPPGGSGGAGGSGGGSGGSGGSGGNPGVDGAPEDLDMQASDFECILRWQKVRSFRITNKLGHMQETLAVANSASGGKYPVGTIIQLVPNEASVKRREGFNAQTHDWEFFSLSTSSSGTTISKRGTTDVVNAFGGNCFNCHNQAQPQWDLVCETGHGCDPLPLSDATL